MNGFEYPENINIWRSIFIEKMEIHSNKAEPWNVTLIDTGELTNTGGRLKKIKDFIKDETFCMTYGDGLSNVNIRNLITHHKKAGKIATLTAVNPEE